MGSQSFNSSSFRRHIIMNCVCCCQYSCVSMSGTSPSVAPAGPDSPRLGCSTEKAVSLGGKLKALPGCVMLDVGSTESSGGSRNRVRYVGCGKTKFEIQGEKAPGGGVNSPPSPRHTVYIYPARSAGHRVHRIKRIVKDSRGSLVPTPKT